MDRWALEGNFCDCVFNKTELKENGGWKQDDDMAATERDPIRCEQYCITRFLDTVTADHNETFSNVCARLTTEGPNQDLWPLYWCDSTYCGVWIDQTVPGGQDPNVDYIINRCNNNGFHSVFDPGPPPPDYTCGTGTNKASTDPGALCANLHLPAQASAAAGASPAHTSTLESTISATQSSAATETGTSTGGAAAAVTDPLSSGDSPNVHTERPLTTATKATIALSSALGILLIACVALFLLRRRYLKRRESALPSVKSRIRYPCDFPPPGSPTTPLISSPTTTRPPLTPPLRLRDRKFLPSILRQSRSPSPPLTPLNPVHFPFPSSPICSPTTNRLVPRHERTPKIYAASPSTPPSSPPPLPPLPPLPPAPAYFHDHRDRGSLGSNSTFAPSTKSTISNTSGGHSISLSSLRNETVSLLSLLPPPPPPPPPPPHPSSPTRPPRPHETPLVIPDLVSPASPTASFASPTTATAVSTPTSPAGPPPNRALPARPGTVQTPVIVVDGASPSPSPEPVMPGGWVGQKIRGRGREQQERTVEMELGGGRR